MVAIAARTYQCGDLFNIICHSVFCFFQSAKVGYFFCNSATFNIVLSINA
jgi:hypothetical protein